MDNTSSYKNTLIQIPISAYNDIPDTIPLSLFSFDSIKDTIQDILKKFYSWSYQVDESGIEFHTLTPFEIFTAGYEAGYKRNA